MAGWLPRTSPSEPVLQVSRETIYRTLLLQERGALKRELTAYLRRRRLERGRRRTPTERSGTLPGAVSTWPPTSRCTSGTPRARGNGGATRTQTGCCGSTARSPWTSLLSQQRMNRVARELNNRPRATLDFRSPADTLNELSLISWVQAESSWIVDIMSPGAGR